MRREKDNRMEGQPEKRTSRNCNLRGDALTGALAAKLNQEIFLLQG
jgi:hypothetical protein